MLDTTFLIMVGLVLIVSLVQLWSVQRVERNQKILSSQNMLLTGAHNASIRRIDNHEYIHQVLATLIIRIDTLLIEKNLIESSLVSDLMVDDGKGFKHNVACGTCKESPPPPRGSIV